jgi:hypothetical protein
MMQTTEPRHRNHLRIHRRFVCGRSASRSLLAESEARPVVMVIAHIFCHEPFEMPFVERDHVVQQIASAARDETFGHAILPGAPNRRANRYNTQALHGFQNLTVKRVLTIKDEILRRREAALRRRLSRFSGAKIIENDASIPVCSFSSFEKPHHRPGVSQARPALLD